MSPATLAAIAVILTTTIITLRYIAACYVRPFAPCRKCKGNGHIRNRIGRGTHDCRRCDATGLRLRWGRHAVNHARRLHRDGTR